MRTVAIIAAAGAGERPAAGMPKAFVCLGDTTLVERAVAGLRESGVVDAVIVAVPSSGTDEATLIPSDPDFEAIGDAMIARVVQAVQTPQGFTSAVLECAYDRAGVFIDDATMVESTGGQVQTVAGDLLAFKITTAVDLLLAEALIAP